MLTIICISSGLTVLAVLCVVAYNMGYDAGYEQGTKNVHKVLKLWDVIP